MLVTVIHQHGNAMIKEKIPIDGFLKFLHALMLMVDIIVATSTDEIK